MAPYLTAVTQWQSEQAEKEIKEFLAGKTEALNDVDPDVWPASELMRRVIEEFFGDPTVYDSCEMVTQLHRIFEWENLAYTLHAPWWNTNTPVDGLQSLATKFFNASWAKLYIPLRPGFEEEALLSLAAIGALPQGLDLSEIDYYLADMRTNLEPMFEREFEPSSPDESRLVDSTGDVLLTPLGTNHWNHGFESDLKFKVLDRWILTTPTDGVDYEETYARCPPLPPGTEVPGDPFPPQEAGGPGEI